MISMLGCRSHSMNLGDSMHMEQSLVGKVLSSWAILPPMVGARSTRKTRKPEVARSRAAWMPLIPPPTTITSPKLLLAFASFSTSQPSPCFGSTIASATTSVMSLISSTSSSSRVNLLSSKLVMQ